MAVCPDGKTNHARTRNAHKHRLTAGPGRGRGRVMREKGTASGAHVAFLRCLASGGIFSFRTCHPFRRLTSFELNVLSTTKKNGITPQTQNYTRKNEHEPGRYSRTRSRTRLELDGANLPVRAHTQGELSREGRAAGAVFWVVASFTTFRGFAKRDRPGKYLRADGTGRTQFAQQERWRTFTSEQTAGESYDRSYIYDIILCGILRSAEDAFTSPWKLPATHWCFTDL